MKLIKADNYQMWCIENQDHSILIDPWLSKKLKSKNAFFIQRRKEKETILNEEEINKVNSIIITAPFDDHLHIESINKFPNNTTIYTSEIVKKVLLKNNIINPIKILSETKTKINSLNVRALPASYPYYNSTFSLLFEDMFGNKIFHEGHRVNFNYINQNNIKADVAILTNEETNLFGFIQLGMNHNKALKACKCLGAKSMFVTGNNPTKTEGFIKYFLSTKKVNDITNKNKVLIYSEEGDEYKFK